MDILDEPKKNIEYNFFKKKDPFEIYEYLSREDEIKLIDIIKKQTLHKISLNEYYKNIADFWKSVDEEEFAEEVLLKINN